MIGNMELVAGYWLLPIKPAPPVMRILEEGWGVVMVVMVVMVVIVGRKLLVAGCLILDT